MLDKFEVLMRWKLSYGLSFLLFGVSDGHIFFDLLNYCPIATFFAHQPTKSSQFPWLISCVFVFYFKNWNIFRFILEKIWIFACTIDPSLFRFFANTRNASTMQEVLLYIFMYYVLYAELRGIFTLQGIVILLSLAAASSCCYIYRFMARSAIQNYSTNSNT